MNKDEFIKFIDGDKTYLEPFKVKVRNIIDDIKFIDEEKELWLTEDNLSDIHDYVITNMNKFKDKWGNGDKIYEAHFKWCVINFIFGRCTKIRENE